MHSLFFFASLRENRSAGQGLWLALPGDGRDRIASTCQHPCDYQRDADDGQEDRPGIASMPRITIAGPSVDRDRLELQVRQRCPAEPADDLDRLARELAGAEQPEEPLPDV